MTFLRTSNRRIVLKALSVLVLSSAAPALVTAADLYDGKTITVVVRVSAGSGGDVSARTFMEGLRTHIPGNPNIVVRNMEGAGGGVALNFTYEKADPDGLTFYYGNWDPMGAISGAKGIRYIPGFRSMGKMAPGILSGELQAGHTAAGRYSRFFVETTKSGETMMLYYHPFFDEAGKEIKPAEAPFAPDVPSVSELYERIHGSAPSGIEWNTYRWLRSNVHATSPAMIAPPGTPEAHIQILREAFQATWTDANFRKKWQSQFDSLPHVNSTEATLASFEGYRSITAEQLAVVERMIAVGQ